MHRGLEHHKEIPEWVIVTQRFPCRWPWRRGPSWPFLQYHWRKQSCTWEHTVFDKLISNLLCNTQHTNNPGRHVITWLQITWKLFCPLLSCAETLEKLLTCASLSSSGKLWMMDRDQDFLDPAGLAELDAQDPDGHFCIACGVLFVPCTPRTRPSAHTGFCPECEHEHRSSFGLIPGS